LPEEWRRRRALLKERLGDYFRVLKVAKRPTWKEYWQIAKLTGLGIVVIGAMGLIITLVFTLVGF
jgi:protein transport protein SEC61 subunit gamma and related proteins